MKCLESREKIADDLISIINSYIVANNINVYIEPFVGGANIIDCIQCNERIAYDTNKYIIELFNYLINDGELPEEILVEQYIDAKAHCNKKGKHKNKYEDWYLGFVGFICSKGNTFFGEYNQYYKEDETKLIEQITLLKDVEFRVQDFFNLEISGAILYLDPPSNKKEKFDIDKFWIKVRELIETDNLVLITAKDAPDDFKIIWESTDKQPIKLFIHETQDIDTDDLIEYDF